MQMRFRMLTLILGAFLLIQSIGCGPASPSVPATTAPEAQTSETPEETAAANALRDPDVMPTINPNANAQERGSIRYLSIGSSYNVNLTHYLYDFLKDAGYEKVEVGVLYYSGLSLEMQYNYMVQDSDAYRFYYNGKGTWTITEGYTMDMVLRLTQWDYITFNTSNPSITKPDDYEMYLTEVMKHVRSFQPDAHFAWVSQWAWQQDREDLHEGFQELYGGDQMRMYNEILEASRTVMKRHPELEYWIPAGTAVQNMRTCKLGDKGDWLLRDVIGHLSYDYGYYLGAMTLAKCLTDFDLEASTFIPVEYAEKFQDPELVAGLKAAVQAAVDDPWHVTENPYQ